MEETLGQKVRRLRLEHGLVLKEVAHAAGRTEGWASKLEDDLIGMPRKTALEGLAQLFKVSVEYLTGKPELDRANGQMVYGEAHLTAGAHMSADAEVAAFAEIGRQVVELVSERQMLKERTFKPLGRGMRRFPIENRVPASDASVRESQLEDDIEVPDALWMGAQLPRVFYVAGNCMALAGIVEGDHVIVDGAKTDPLNGDIVIAQVNGGLTLKFFYKAGNMIELRPDAPGYEPIYVGPDDELIIIGIFHNVYGTGKRSRR